MAGEQGKEESEQHEKKGGLSVADMILPNLSFGVGESRQAKKHSADHSWLFLLSHRSRALHDQLEIDDFFETPLFSCLPYLSQHQLSSSILGSRSFTFACLAYAFSAEFVGASWQILAQCRQVQFSTG